ncbi:hypothetical protein [Candidatus Liberibacter solanacearum]|uniref:hypothetical protein n=1 Tax=Candidatus Liberibacter solanacearum TaxID=556287 RepID=UPI0013792B5E|nr:hypothetical protein [Candidatus Liberibacter solanacearum]
MVELWSCEVVEVVELKKLVDATISHLWAEAVVFLKDVTTCNHIYFSMWLHKK